MNNLESIWQRLQSRNQYDSGAQRNYWLDLLRGRTARLPQTSSANAIPAPTGSGPYQPIGAQQGGIPAPTGSGPYQPLNLPKPNIPLYSGSGPYQPMGAGQQRGNILDVLRRTFGRQ